MSKLYFLVPSATVTEQIVTDLQAAGYDGSSIGIIASDRHARGDLPTARATDASDVADASKRGALAGGSAALLAGLAAAMVPGGIAVGGAVLATAALAGTALGGAIAGALGLSTPNEEIAVFERAIEGVICSSSFVVTRMRASASNRSWWIAIRKPRSVARTTRSRPWYERGSLCQLCVRMPERAGSAMRRSGHCMSG